MMSFSASGLAGKTWTWDTNKKRITPGLSWFDVPGLARTTWTWDTIVE